MPIESIISRPMRAISARSASSKTSIGRALARRTGSPYLRTCTSAASRRAISSGVSAGGASGSTSTPSSSRSSATRGRLLAAPAGHGWPKREAISKHPLGAGGPWRFLAAPAGHGWPKREAISKHPLGAGGPWRLLRIHVHAERRVAGRPVGRGLANRGVDGGHRARAVARLHDHLRALAPTQAEQRRRSHPVGAQALADGPGGQVRRAGGLRRADDPDERRERRVAQRAPAGQLER